MLFARKHHLVLPYLFRVSCNFQEIHATLKIFTSGLQIWFKGSFLVLYHFFSGNFTLLSIVRRKMDRAYGLFFKYLIYEKLVTCRGF